MQKWDDVPKSQREFQIRLMEIFAGFLEHTDVQYGKIVDEIERQGELDNTLIIYINSDNGPSAEGINGTIAELLAHNNMPSTIEQQIDVLNKDYGGLDALGGPKLDNHVSPWLDLFGCSTISGNQASCSTSRRNTNSTGHLLACKDKARWENSFSVSSC
jgi:arylsulfatase A-like enzyme